MITITFDRKTNARAILEEAKYITREFGYVTLADIYDLSGVSYSKGDTTTRYNEDELSRMVDIVENETMSCLIIFDPKLGNSAIVRAGDGIIVMGVDLAQGSDFTAMGEEIADGQE